MNTLAERVRGAVNPRWFKPVYGGGGTAGMEHPAGQTVSDFHAALPNRSRRALLLSLVALAFTVSASARQLKIDRLSTEIFVQQDSSLDINETIEARFIGVWHGLYRSIPIEYQTPQGFEKSLFVSNVDMTDSAGRKLKFESSRQGAYLRWKIYVDDATDAVRTIHVHYVARNGLSFFEDHDELYWNIIGAEQDIPIADASAQILLPTGVTGLHAENYSGGYGSRGEDATVSSEDNTVEVGTTQPLGSHHGLTVVVGWDKGFVKEPGPGEKAMQFLASNWPLVIPLPVFLFMFWLWSTRGRDPRSGPVAVQYEPPEGMSPAEAGTLVDESAAMRDITATIVDLAVRGYIVIEEKEKSEMMGLLHNKDYVFHLKIAPNNWTDLKSHERQLLSGIFSYGGETDVELSSLQNRFYRSLPGIKDSIFDALMKRGYFLHRPDYVRIGYIGGGIVVAVLLFFLGSSVARMVAMGPVPFFIAAILCGGIIAGFGWFMPTRTAGGVKALAGVLGFEDFLSHVEADRLERVSRTPETFEKFLPYAMALGVEKKWVGAFQSVYTQPPSWYQGGFYSGGFYPIMFINSLDNMTMSASSVMASAPRSSGGSGFGGGGFSGGGMGGGSIGGF
jgi:predicted membrane protein DUF2207